jgi:hypothetical protein
LPEAIYLSSLPPVSKTAPTSEVDEKSVRARPWREATQNIRFVDDFSKIDYRQGDQKPNKNFIILIIIT